MGPRIPGLIRAGSCAIQKRGCHKVSGERSIYEVNTSLRNRNVYFRKGSSALLDEQSNVRQAFLLSSTERDLQVLRGA